jgi:hypothetical protein
MGYGERLEKVAVAVWIFYHFPASKGIFLLTTSMMNRYSICGLSICLFHFSEYFNKSTKQNIKKYSRQRTALHRPGIALGPHIHIGY